MCDGCSTGDQVNYASIRSQQIAMGMDSGVDRHQWVWTASPSTEDTVSQARTRSDTSSADKESLARN